MTIIVSIILNALMSFTYLPKFYIDQALFFKKITEER